jgi:opacity protein-like surface antigen
MAMKKIEAALLATTLAVGLALAGSSAFAADMPQSDVQGTVTAPAPEALAGTYISVFGGYSFPFSATGVYTTNSAAFTMPFGSGFIIGGAIGTHLAPDVRGEVELSYASHNVSGLISATLPGGGTFTAATTTGSESTLFLLGNLWLDIDTGSGITPYLGGGLGLGVVMPNVKYSGLPGGSFTTAGYGLAAQLGAGVKFAIADNMSLDLAYRAKGVFNTSLKGTGTDGGLSGVNEVDQSVTIGLDIGF